MFVNQVELNTVVRDVSGEPLSEEDWEKAHAVTRH